MPAQRTTILFQWICAVWVAIVGFIAITFRYYFFFWLMLFILILPPLILAAVPFAAATIGVRRFIKRRYLEGVGWLLVPAAGALIATLGYDTSEYVIFHTLKPVYDRIVGDATSGRCSTHDRSKWLVRVDLVSRERSVIVVFPWSGFWASWYGIVYDATDEISRAPAQRSQQWQASEVGKTLKYLGALSALGGHYYVAGRDY
jgi:hypothetical protein